MKGVSHPTNDVSLNPSSNHSIRDVIGQVDADRRQFIRGGVGAAALAAAGGLTLGGLVQHRAGRTDAAEPRLPGHRLRQRAASRAPVADMVKVPAGYTANVLVAWGDPIMPGGAPFAATPARPPPSSSSSSACTTTACTSSRCNDRAPRDDDRRRKKRHAACCASTTSTRTRKFCSPTVRWAPATPWPRRASRRPRMACPSPSCVA